MSRVNLSRRHGGFTLLEGLVTVAILSVLMALVVPSAIEWIRIQRVKASADELFTDLQFARSEAVRRNLDVKIVFQSVAAESCYTVHTFNATGGSCLCSLGAGLACGNSIARTELKTVSLPASNQITLTSNLFSSIYASARGFVGGTAPLQVTVDGGSNRKLEVRTNVVGRPTICAPIGSKVKGYAECA